MEELNTDVPESLQDQGQVADAGTEKANVNEQSQAQPQEGEEFPADPIVELSEDDVNEGIKQHKTNVQKRIDKLVFERNTSRDEIDALKREINEIKEAKPAEKKYSDQELQAAMQHAIENGDYNLLSQAVDQKINNAKREVVEETQSHVKQTAAEKQKQDNLWKSFISNLPESVSKDSDYDFGDTNSAVHRYATYYLNNYGNDYRKNYGDYYQIQAANDAMLAVTKMKQEKMVNKKLKSTEKQLAKEKLKTQSGYSSASSSGPMDDGQGGAIKVNDPNVDANLEQFLKEKANNEKNMYDGIKLVSR